MNRQKLEVANAQQIPKAFPAVKNFDGKWEIKFGIPGNYSYGFGRTKAVARADARRKWKPLSATMPPIPPDFTSQAAKSSTESPTPDARSESK